MAQGIKTWCLPRHIDVLCHVLQGSVGWVDWGYKRARIKGLECQAKELGFYQQAMGSQ